VADPTVPGIRPDAVAAWLTANVGGLEPPFEYVLVAGGHSNLTFRVVDANGRPFVLRRPPLGKTLPSAHDMGREFRILSGLAVSSVPVPTPLGICEDTTVNEAPFYAMDFVDGAILRTPAQSEAAFARPEQRAKMADSLISVLADLHLLRPEDVGLGDLGRSEGYLERQLRRWHRQWNDSKTREIDAIEEVHAALSANPPAQQGVSIVHGDFRLDNVVAGFDGKVAAVLDWELCTLGDPLADLGGLLISWVEYGEDGTHHYGGTPTAVPGFPTRAELIDTYAARSALDVSDIDYYVAFSYWRLACIGEGVYARYKAGAMGAERDVSLAQIAQNVTTLAELAAESLR
jgi:aminoglycoside phosphotransferase (APT) family kinase protein